MKNLPQTLLLAISVLGVVACDTEAESPLELTVLEDRALEGVHVGAAGEHLDFAIARTEAGPRAVFEVEGEAILSVADGVLRVGGQEIPADDLEQVGLVMAELEQSVQGQQLGELALELEAELGDEYPTSVDRLLAPTNDDPTELKYACLAYPIYDAVDLPGPCQANCLECKGCSSIWQSVDCFATGALCEWQCYDY